MERDRVRLLAVRLLWGFGVLLTGGGIAALALRAPLSGSILLGGGLVALGLNVLLSGGELSLGLAPRPFTARGVVVRGLLEARTGFSDLRVASCSPDRIAAIQYGPFGRPEFRAAEGVAYVGLKGSLLRPNIAPWRADLAPNVLWDLEARSLLGDLSFDLRNLRLDHVTASTALGRLSVIAPVRGYVSLELKTTIGEIALQIPPSTGARISIRRGRLTTLRIKNDRLLAVGAHQYSTPDAETADAQVEIQIEALAGDIILT